MKNAKKSTVILIMSLLLTSVLTGCSGRDTATDKSKNDMVESTPLHSEEDLFNENDTIVDSESNIVDDAGNIVQDAGDAVGNVVEDVGNAAEDVTNGIGEGVKDMTR